MHLTGVTVIVTLKLGPLEYGLSSALYRTTVLGSADIAITDIRVSSFTLLFASTM